MKRWILGVVALLAVATAHAQPVGTPDEMFELMWNATKTQSERDHKAFTAAVYSKNADKEDIDKRTDRRNADSVLHSYGTRRADALEPQNAAAVVNRASVAIKTGVEDTEAGISIAPFALLGTRSLRGVSLIFAALADQQVRTGVGWTYESKPTLTFKDLELDVCPVADAYTEEVKLRLQRSFVVVCTEIIQRIPPKPRPADDDEPWASWDTAMRACGFLPGDPADGRPGPRDTPPLVLDPVFSAMAKAVDHEKQTAGLEDRIDGLSLHLKRLGAWSLPTFTGCITDEAIETAYTQAEWARARVNLGTRALFDFFPHKAGFNPDPNTALPKGELQHWEIMGEFRREQAGHVFSVGAALGASRARPTDGTSSIVSPRFSLSGPIFNLSSTRLWDRDDNGRKRLNVLAGGELPPHVVLGFDAKAEINLDPSATQTTRLNSAEFLVFLDFKISGKLSFRLGAPFKAELVDKKDGDNVVRSSLQWSFPVSVVTVIKL